jgi:hypothetical protein
VTQIIDLVKIQANFFLNYILILLGWKNSNTN